MSADRPVSPAPDTVTDDLRRAAREAAIERLSQPALNGGQHWDSDVEGAPKWIAIMAANAVIEAVVPLIRERVAAELIAHARKVQAAIDDPDTDTDTMSALIDHAEGIWSAIRTVDEATWRREWEATMRRRNRQVEAVAGTGPLLGITPAVPSTFAAPVTYTATEDFYEPDEPVADVQAAFDAADKGVTKRPAEEPVIFAGWMSLPPEIQVEGERAASVDTELCGDVYADGPPLSRHTCGRPRGHIGAHLCRCPRIESYTWPAKEADRG